MTLTLWAISYTVVGLLVAGFEAVRAGWDGDAYMLRGAPILGAAWPLWFAVCALSWVSDALFRFGQRLRERQS